MQHKLKEQSQCKLVASGSLVNTSHRKTSNIFLAMTETFVVYFFNCSLDTIQCALNQPISLSINDFGKRIPEMWLLCVDESYESVSQWVNSSFKYTLLCYHRHYANVNNLTQELIVRANQSAIQAIQSTIQTNQVTMQANLYSHSKWNSDLLEHYSG